MESLSANDSSDNVTTDPPPWFWDAGWNRFVHGVFSWLFPILVLSGGFLNAACFVVTAANRKSFPRNSRLYMLLISATDTVLLLAKGPIYYLDVMATLVTDPWPWYRPVRGLSPPVTRIYYIISYLTVFGAPFFQLGLTVDRAVAVCFPMKAKQLMNRRNSAILLVVVLALALSFPALTIYMIKWDPEYGITIVDDDVYYMFFTQYELYVGRLLLAILLLLGTALICFMLLRSSRGLGEPAVGDDKRKSRAIRLSLVLVFLNVNFLLFTLPWSLLNAVESFGALGRMPLEERDLIFEYLNVLLFMNNAFNWMAYFMGQGFRNNFMATFRLDRCFRGKGGSGRGGSGSGGSGSRGRTGSAYIGKTTSSSVAVTAT